MQSDNYRPRQRRHDLTATIYDRRGNILSVGHNSYKKTHPKMLQLSQQVLDDPHHVFLHAEVAALIKLAKLRRHASPHRIHIERYDRMGRPKLAAPCPMCQLAISLAGIKHITYTQDEDV